MALSTLLPFAALVFPTYFIIIILSPLHLHLSAPNTRALRCSNLSTCFLLHKMLLPIVISWSTFLSKDGELEGGH
jgi:hypothetical protein